MQNKSCLPMLVSVPQLLDNVENKMKGTCVEGTIPKLFRGKMVVRRLSLHSSSFDKSTPQFEFKPRFWCGELKEGSLAAVKR